MQGSARGDGHPAARWIAGLVLALALVSVAIVSAVAGHTRERDSLDRALNNAARRQSDALDHYFARARSLTLVTAANPAFREFYEAPGDRREKVVGNTLFIRDAKGALSYLEQLFPGSIGEACFIDRTGPENARAVAGSIAPISDLSPDETRRRSSGPRSPWRPDRSTRRAPTSRPTRTAGSCPTRRPLRSRTGPSRR